MKWLLLACFFFSCRQATKPAAKDQQSPIAHAMDSTIPSKPDTHPGLQHVPEISASKIIVPGERIGKTLLGTAAAELERLLGRPDMSDAAMGKAWLTWKGKGSKNGHATELNIYTTYKDSTMREKTVRQIRTTSSFFSTDKGAQVDSSLSFIRQSFPGLKKVGSYKGGSKTYLVYDDRDQGIAFETVANNQEICTGIIVHQKETDVLDVYLTLHPDMQRY